METPRPPKEIFQDFWAGPNDLYYEYWSYPEDLRRRLDECTDPNCPALLIAPYLTVEARREKVQKRRDNKRTEYEVLHKGVLERIDEIVRDHCKRGRELADRKTALIKQKRELHEQEKKVRERELRLENLGAENESLTLDNDSLTLENESLRQIIADMEAYQHNQTLQNSQKDLNHEHASIEEDAPDAFGAPTWVPAKTPSLPKTSPATSPASSPPPIASSPPSSPVHSQCHQPETPNQDAANKILHSCIMCTKPDTNLMIGCQNSKACLSRHWGQGLGGINSGDDAWFHISHLGMTEATFHELARQNEDWYCPQCQKPTDNTDPDENTMIELPSPQCQQPMDKFDRLKARRQAEQAELRRQAELRAQAEIRGQAETHNPKPPTATKRRRQAQTPKPKEATKSEDPPKKSNRRKQVRWTNPLERAALIDAMRTVILAGDRTERRYQTASQLMLTRSGFDRSRYQIKNKWNRAVRAEAQKQGVPEDRHKKADMKTITGIQDPAARQRKRQEEREELEREKERERIVELGMVQRDTAELVAEMEDGPGEGNGNDEEDADGEEVYEEDDGGEDEEEEGPQSKRQRFF